MAQRAGLRQVPGRPRKVSVPRKTTSIALPLPVRLGLEEAAERGGWGSLSDYMLSVLAPASGHDEFIPEPKYPVDGTNEQDRLVS